MRLLFTLGIAIAFVLLYLIAHRVRHAIAWMGNTDRPKERRVPVAVVCALFGAVAGYLIFPTYSCMSAGKGLSSCVLMIGGIT